MVAVAVVGRAVVVARRVSEVEAAAAAASAVPADVGLLDAVEVDDVVLLLGRA